MDRTGLQEILTRYLDGTATDQETAFLETYYDRAAGNSETFDTVLMAQHREEIIKELTKEITRPATPVHRIHFLKTAWFKYAAAIIIITGIGAYLWNTQQKEKPSVTQTN